ncbi:probable glycolate oxidase [Rhynchosporium graminicola]|uniref:Oxidase FUB9 n=1 Tax=Rhynchosporium graminicola TaxID=2792576 RepID=A0A1E1KYA0_9HELO|nr:probable glycolate oxidase [Rhynchosporium commune]
MGEKSVIANMSNEVILSIEDLQEAGSKKLPTSAREFFNSGATSQTTLHENSTAFSKYRLRPRVLKNVSKCSTSATVLGSRIAFPLGISPAGVQGMAHPEGEKATARACAVKGIHMGVSSFANHTVEEITAAGKAVGPMTFVMQLYTMKDRALEERIIKRAEAAGCVAIFLTADSPVLGVRYNEWRNDFRAPAGLGFPMIERSTEQLQSQTHDSGFLEMNSDTHSWAEEIPWLRAKTKMQIWIKGVLTAEDVLLAREYGCDGVIVSNHGGRQLDGSPATIDVLAECVDAAAGEIKIHVDGGFRSGADIFKAIAIGAECCWIGRPAIWGLAYDGQIGVEKAVEILYDEFRRCMMLTGCKSVAEISKASIELHMGRQAEPRTQRGHTPLGREDITKI